MGLRVTCRDAGKPLDSIPPVNVSVARAELPIGGDSLSGGSWEHCIWCLDVSHLLGKTAT
jgi:hypothetical protein